MSYISSVIASRFDHPLLASLLGVSILFALTGLFISEADALLGSPFPAALVDLWRPVIQPIADLHPVAPAFMGVFSILFGVLALIGYGIFGTAKLLSILRDQMAPTST